MESKGWTVYHYCYFDLHVNTSDLRYYGSSVCSQISYFDNIIIYVLNLKIFTRVLYLSILDYLSYVRGKVVTLRSPLCPTRTQWDFGGQGVGNLRHNSLNQGDRRRRVRDKTSTDV